MRRREDAWTLARETAATLRGDYGASRVLLFGSLAKGYFGRWSDVDVIVFGIPADRRAQAIASLSIEPEPSNPAHLGLDLLAAEELAPDFLAAAERDGIELDGR